MSAFSQELEKFGPTARWPTMTLDQSRAYVLGLAKAHYENFPVVSLLFPKKLRPHVASIYAYCRWSDDLADEVTGSDASLGLLDWWERELDACFAGDSRHPVMIALGETVRAFAIPREPFIDLLSAFRQDQSTFAYETFEDLLDYCRRSANPVGRLVLYLLGSHEESRLFASDSVCTGLQLANFWQDVARDQAIGRIYLPREDMLRFGVSNEEIVERRFSPRFADLLAFEVNRAETFLLQGAGVINGLPWRMRWVIGCFAQGGLALLRKIRQSGHDVLRERPRLRHRDTLFVMANAMRLACLAEPGRSATPAIRMDSPTARST
ncbi:MAG: squalene synthase HpnC [Planctomycetota bacterium]